VVRIEPARTYAAASLPAPSGQVPRGLVPPGVWTWDSGSGIRAELRVASEGWLHTGRDFPGHFELLRIERERADLTIDPIDTVFAEGFRLRRVGTPAEFVDALRDNPGLDIGPARRTDIGGRPALSTTIRALPKPPYPDFCERPCTLLYSLRGATIFQDDVSPTALHALEVDGRLVVVGHNLLDGPTGARHLREARRVIDSMVVSASPG
jgi:hypothetical protein